MSIPIPEALMGRGWADIYIVKGVSDALVLTIRELRKLICQSRTKQQGTSHGCIVYSPHWLRLHFAFVAKRVFIYLHIRGAFGVARFGLTGQCEGLRIVERVTDWLHVLLFCISANKINPCCGSQAVILKITQDEKIFICYRSITRNVGIILFRSVQRGH